jgi:hypothetical protein
LTTESDYSADEWQKLTQMPALVGLAVILAEDSGRRGRREELASLSTAAAEIAADFADNTLVQAVLPDASKAAQSDELKGYAKAKSTDEALRVALAWSASLNQVLAGRTTFEEADGYKRFVVHTGVRVANASADAEFFGIGGETLSRDERKTLLAIVDALDVEIDY